MARPRTNDLGTLLDVAEQIATSTGPSGLTLRRLAAEAGASNGSIYHSFSSKEELLARVWARAARRMLTALEARVSTVLTGGMTGAPTEEASAIEAVVAAALAPVDFAIEHPCAARLFFMQRRDQLFSDNLPQSASDELDAIQSTFTGVLIGLAQARWNRRDRLAVDAIAACVVDLPGGLMQRKLRAGATLDDQTRTQIEAACRAILALELPPPPPKTATPNLREEP
jgi:AcrR family transcriptional regulator